MESPVRPNRTHDDDDDNDNDKSPHDENKEEEEEENNKNNQNHHENCTNSLALMKDYTYYPFMCTQYDDVEYNIV